MDDQSILSKMKIAVVDDHDLVREGMAAILASRNANDVTKFSTARDLVSCLDSGTEFDFYIIDIELPDLDGFVLIEMIRARNPVAHIIVSTVHDEIWTLRKLLARDVNAIIYKSGEGSEIVTAIHEILKGNNYNCEEGKTSREIAASMFVTENTIEAHRKSLFSKLGAVNVADLIIKAIEKGYLKKSGIIR